MQVEVAKCKSTRSVAT